MSLNVRTLLLAAILTAPSLAYAHGGKLDKNGCHNDRKSGGYHCHGTALAAPALQPDSSTTPPRTLAQTIDIRSDRVELVQVLLRALGEPVAASGTLDAATREAIQRFETSARIEATGRITDALLLRLARSVALRCGQRR